MSRQKLYIKNREINFKMESSAGQYRSLGKPRYDANSGYKEKTGREEKYDNTVINSERHFCKKCGSEYNSGEYYCAECGNILNESVCGNCGFAINPDNDICENCGTFQIKTQCSFCGAKKDENDTFCCECGSPAAGIECNKCGYISQFNFCPKCNQALTETARAERKAAEMDPQFLKIKTSAEKLLKFVKETDQLIQEIDILNEEAKSEQESKQVSDILKNYFKKNTHESSRKEENIESKEKLKTKKQIDLADRLKIILDREAENIAEAEEVKNAINNRALEERKKVVKEMISDINALAVKQDFKNAQQARDWFNARKIESNNCVFYCNHAGAIHPNPNHCGQPQKGGKWIYVEKEIIWEDNGDSGYWKVAYL